MTSQPKNVGPKGSSASTSPSTRDGSGSASNPKAKPEQVGLGVGGVSEDPQAEDNLSVFKRLPHPSRNPSLATVEPPPLTRKPSYFKYLHNDEEDRLSQTDKALLLTKIGFCKLFRFAGPVDYLLMFFGILFSLLSSALFPILIYAYSLFFRLAYTVENGCSIKLKLHELRAMLPILEIAIAFGASSFSYHICFTFSAIRQINKIRVAYVEAVLRKDFHWLDNYIDRNLNLRMTNDVSVICSGIGVCLPKIIYCTLCSILLVILCFYINPKLALVTALLFGLCVGIISYLKAKCEKNLVLKEQAAYQEADGVAHEVLSNIRAVHIYGGEIKALSAYRNSLFTSCSLWRTVFLAAFLSAFLWSFPNFLLSLVYYISITYFEDEGALRKFKKNPCNALQSLLPPSNPGNPAAPSPSTSTPITGWRQWELPSTPKIFHLILCFTSAASVSTFLSNAPFLIAKIRQAQKIAAEVFFTIDWKSRIKNLSDKGNIPDRKALGKLEMQKVNFRYMQKSSRKFAVDEISMTIHPGEMVTIFGLPGSGKSTILNIFQRLYDSDSGTVRLDGINILGLNVGWLRRQFGVVPDEITLLNMTVKDNLLLGNLNCSFNQIVSACIKVEIHQDILNLEQGYNTFVGSTSNVKLSPVQLKKLYFARVLLQNPSILLLDDFINDLDPKFEACARRILDNLRRKCTIVLTAYKFNSFIETCDKIYVMKDGEIVERGSHQKLMREKNLYYKLMKESLEDSIALKPYFNSQLQNYKFAETIQRKHQLHDNAKMLDYSALLENNSNNFRNSVFLRHVVDRESILATPRVIGGYHKYCNFTFESFETNIYYNRWIVWNKFLRDRARSSLLADDVASLVFGEGNRGSRQTLRVIHSSHTPPSGLGRRTVSFDPFSSRNRKNSPSPVTQNKGSRLLNRFSLLRKPSGKKDKNALFKEYVSRVVVKPSVSTAPSRSILLGKSQKSFKQLVKEYRSAALADDKLQHYFGWTINSSADDESISSQDSRDFWNYYHLNLMSAIVKRTQGISGNLLPFARFAWPYLILTSVTSVLFSCGILYEVQVVIKLIRGYLSVDRSDIHMSCARLAILGLILMLISFVQEIILGFGTYHMSNRIRLILFESILKQRMEWFDFPQNDISFLRESLASDVSAIEIAIMTLFTAGCEFLAMIGTSSFVLFTMAYHYPETDWLFLLVPVFMLVLFCEGRFRGRHNNMVSSFLQPCAKIIFNIVTNLRTVQILNVEGYFLQCYREALAKCSRWIVCVSVVRSVFFGLSQCAFYTFFGIWFLLTKDKLIYTTNTSGMFHFLLIIELAYYVYYPASYALAGLPSYSDAKISASLFTQVLKNRKKLEVSRRQNISMTFGPDDPPPKIVLDNVAFAYPLSRDIQVLKGVSLEILAGKYVAFVGNSIPSSSALMSILLNIYSPTEGKILLNDVDYLEINDDSIRQAIGFVAQDPLFMSNLTVAENIAYGDNSRTVDMDEIEAAAEFACIHEHIQELKYTYDTKLEDVLDGPQGFVLRQRLAIARAVIDNPKIMLIDQATTSVDTESDKILQQVVMKLRVGRTMIVTSQRIEPIRTADNIVVLNDGVIAEMGTDKDLMKKRGIYYDLVMSQRLFEKNFSYFQSYFGS